jgi:hypothetical protein
MIEALVIVAILKILSAALERRYWRKFDIRTRHTVRCTRCNGLLTIADCRDAYGPSKADGVDNGGRSCGIYDSPRDPNKPWWHGA